MNAHIVDYDTGFPAPFQYGAGKYFTPEFIRQRQLYFRKQPYAAITVDVPQVLNADKPAPRDPVVQKRRKKRAERTPRKCKRDACGTIFMADKKETLCSNECRYEWGREYRIRWKAARREKKNRETPKRALQQLALI